MHAELLEDDQIVRDGRDGRRGPRGERGLQGERGLRGERGERGERGPAGRDGINGKDGAPGIDGKDATAPTPVPWQASFERDVITGRTVYIDIAAADPARPRWRITPRWEAGQVTAALITPI